MRLRIHLVVFLLLSLLLGSGFIAYEKVKLISVDKHEISIHTQHEKIPNAMVHDCCDDSDKADKNCFNHCYGSLSVYLVLPVAISLEHAPGSLPANAKSFYQSQSPPTLKRPPIA